MNLEELEEMFHQFSNSAPTEDQRFDLLMAVLESGPIPAAMGEMLITHVQRTTLISDGRKPVLIEAIYKAAGRSRSLLWRLIYRLRIILR